MSKTVEFTLKIPRAEGTFIKEKMPSAYHGTYNIKFDVNGEKTSIDLAMWGMPPEQIGNIRNAILQSFIKDGYIEGKPKSEKKYSPPSFKVASFTPASKCGSDVEKISQTLVKAMTGKTIGAMKKLVEAEGVILGDEAPDPDVATADPADLKKASMEAGLVKANNSLKAQKITPAKTSMPLDEVIKGKMERRITKWFSQNATDPQYTEQARDAMISFGIASIRAYLQGEITSNDLYNSMIAEAQKNGMFPKRTDKNDYTQFADEVRAAARTIKKDLLEQRAKRAAEKNTKHIVGS